MSRIFLWAMFLTLSFNSNEAIITATKSNLRNEKNENLLIPGSSQFCEGCYATVEVLIQEFTQHYPDVKGPYRMDAKWDELKQTLCDTDKLRKYVYSPPKMMKVSTL